MDHTTMLTDVLKLHFGWNLARIKCLSCLIIALFKVKTVNFAELATAFSGSAKPDSHYRRIQRFFGLDRRIGHLASMSPQKNERLTPIKG